LEGGNRKLIRPALTEVKERRAVKKQVPPDQTNAENFYYMKQMQSKHKKHTLRGRAKAATRKAR